MNQLKLQKRALFLSIVLVLLLTLILEYVLDESSTSTPGIDRNGVLVAVAFVFLNIRLWEHVVLRLLGQSPRIDAKTRDDTTCNRNETKTTKGTSAGISVLLTLKTLVLLLLVYALSRGGNQFIISFLIGFLGLLGLWVVFLIVLPTFGK